VDDAFEFVEALAGAIALSPVMLPVRLRHGWLRRKRRRSNLVAVGT